MLEATKQMLKTQTTIAVERNEMTCVGRKQEQVCDEDYSVQKCALCSEVLFTSRFGGHLWRLAGDTSKNYLSVHLHELLSDHVLDHHPSHCENCDDEEAGFYVCSSFAPFHLSFALFHIFTAKLHSGCLFAGRACPCACMIFKIPLGIVLLQKRMPTHQRSTPAEYGSKRAVFGAPIACATCLLFSSVMHRHLLFDAFQSFLNNF